MAVHGLGTLISLILLSYLAHALGPALGRAPTHSISIAVDFVLHRRRRIRHRETGAVIPSCPWKWPDGQGDVAKFLEGMENSDSWGASFGGCYRIWSGTRAEIVISKPEDIKTAFVDSDRHRKAPDNDSGYLMSQVLGKCLGLISGREYECVRETVRPFFTYTQSGSYLERIQNRTSQYLNDQLLRNNGDEQLSETQPNGQLPEKVDKAHIKIDPVEDFKFLPFLIIADTLYGPLSADMERRLVALAPVREQLFQYVIHGGLSRFRISRYLPTAANRVLRAFRRQWHAFNVDAYDRARLEGLDNTVVVQLFRSAESGAISWEHCHQTLDEMLFANLDVTIGALSWNLVHLADNPRVQHDLRCEFVAQELQQNHPDQVMTGAAASLHGDQRSDGAIATSPNDRGPQISTHAPLVSTHESKYLQSSSTLLAACILESSRLRPLAAFTVPQAAPTDRLVDGYLIPAYTSLVVDAYALNIKDPYWGEDRDAYRPKRFMGRAGAEMRYRYWRFGFGPRQCMGKYVADLILKTVLATLVRQGELSIPPAESTGWHRDRTTWISRPKIKLVFERLE